MVWKTNHIKYRSCKSKIRYKTYNDARRNAKVIERRTGEKLYPYECNLCGGWHLSHEEWEDK